MMIVDVTIQMVMVGALRTVIVMIMIAMFILVITTQEDFGAKMVLTMIVTE